MITSGVTITSLFVRFLEPSADFFGIQRRVSNLLLFVNHTFATRL